MKCGEWDILTRPADDPCLINRDNCSVLSCSPTITITCTDYRELARQGDKQSIISFLRFIADQYLQTELDAYLGNS